MTLDRDFERRIATSLHAELDGATAPHPDWASSPAAARVAAARGGIRWPGRLLAIAAVLALAGGVAIALSQRQEGVHGCPTLVDYAAASARPTPALGEAPGVSFPPVAPDATPTTGLLEPGSWAVLADDKGLVAQIRGRDVRACGRLPDIRSGWVGGSLALATADVRVLRDGFDHSWLGTNGMFHVGLGGTDLGRASIPLVGGATSFGVPGVDHRTLLHPGSTFETSSDLVLDLPPSDLVASVYPAWLETSDETPSKPSDVGWIIRPGRIGDRPTAFPSDPPPGPTQTTGDLRPGTWATIDDATVREALTVTDVDQIPAYPGREPSPGNVFVEGRLVIGAGSVAGTGVSRWRAVDGDGRELAIIASSEPGQSDAGVLDPLAPATFEDDGFPGGWLVIDAPRTGLIRLELRRNDSPDPVLSYLVREP